MTQFPIGRAAALSFFTPPQDIRSRVAQELGPNVCRWCLEKFDPESQQPRTTQERGALRAHLKMSDNGSELIICDNCWASANGFAVFIQGQAVPCFDPEIVPNMLLRSK